MYQLYYIITLAYDISHIQYKTHTHTHTKYMNEIQNI